MVLLRGRWSPSPSCADVASKLATRPTDATDATGPSSTGQDAARAPTWAPLVRDIRDAGASAQRLALNPSGKVLVSWVEKELLGWVHLRDVDTPANRFKFDYSSDLPQPPTTDAYNDALAAPRPSDRPVP